MGVILDSCMMELVDRIANEIKTASMKKEAGISIDIDPQKGEMLVSLTIDEKFTFKLPKAKEELRSDVKKKIDQSKKKMEALIKSLVSKNKKELVNNLKKHKTVIDDYIKTNNTAPQMK